MPTTCTVYSCPGADPETENPVGLGAAIATRFPDVSMMHTGDATSKLGVEEIVQGPASSEENPPPPEMT
jgi:hypothetical protein